MDTDIDRGIVLKLLDVMPARYLSIDPDTPVDVKTLVEDVTAIVEAMWPMKVVDMQKGTIEHLSKDEATTRHPAALLPNPRKKCRNCHRDIRYDALIQEAWVHADGEVYCRKSGVDRATPE